ncbi:MULTISPECIES: membrane protein insertase YidC [Alteribacter]|uniref:Membrane protein insertase YidC n=1 Tax=Alteribacter keqinensis TaxID=2483800 RepID=A0A3M7TUA1_9BACI|nr:MULTISPECIES: membrane protein insertase YidC [Alteribacter]MBM7095460.1 membrane protein insertase YidC [Alteribacter salitolerans]RNA67933.1 membrane protein insertase YidC [Alteribacter keqinensis]
MEKTSASLRKYQLLIVFGLLLVTLAGCGASTEPINAETTGVFNHYVVWPFSFLIKFFAGMFAGNYGLSLVFMTFLIRLALMPLMMKQYKGQRTTREKMAHIQPAMKEIQEKYKDRKNPENQKKLQQEMMALYKEHNFNPITSMGCLPMLIQFPIMIGFYYAIMRTPEIAQHSFLWFNLGQTDMILPFIAGGVYLIQFRVSMSGMDDQQQKQMAMLGYVTPIIMGVFSFNVAAALPLYWSVSGLLLIFQTLLFKTMYNSKKQTAETTTV